MNISSFYHEFNSILNFLKIMFNVWIDLQKIIQMQIKMEIALFFKLEYFKCTILI